MLAPEKKISVERKLVRAACPHDCPDTCAMQITVENGVAVKVEGAKDHPFTAGTLCTKVARYLERTYSKDRVLFPQKRVGAKGRGEFERISWDEALDTIAEKFRAIEAEDPQGILPYDYAGTMGYVQWHSMGRRFFNRLGASRLDRTICSSAGKAGMRITLGGSLGMDPERFDEAKLILIWGSNPIVSNLHLWSRVQEAKRRGAKLVAIDPYRSLSAEKCHEHLAPLPGTDAAQLRAAAPCRRRNGGEEHPVPPGAHRRLAPSGGRGGALHLGIFRHERREARAAGSAAKIEMPQPPHDQHGGDRECAARSEAADPRPLCLQLQPGRGRARLGKGGEGLFSGGPLHRGARAIRDRHLRLCGHRAAGDHAARAPRRAHRLRAPVRRGELPRDRAAGRVPAEQRSVQAARRAHGVRRRVLRGLRRRYLPPGDRVVESAHAGHRVGVAQGERLAAIERTRALRPVRARQFRHALGKVRVLQRNGEKHGHGPLTDLYSSARVGAVEPGAREPVSPCNHLAAQPPFSQFVLRQYAFRHRRSERAELGNPSGRCRGAIDP